MCTVYTLRWGKVEMASSWASFSDLGAWRCRITRWITGAGDWWLVTASSAPSVPSVPVSMISVSITLRAKEPQVCQVCQVPMCHRNPVASSQSASLIQKLHSTSHPRCSIHVVIIGHHVSEIFWDILRWHMLVTICHLCRTFRCSLLNAAGLWSPATLVKPDQSHGTSQRSWNPGSFSHEIMTKTLDTSNTLSNHYHTPVKIGNIGNDSQASGFVEVLLRMLRFQRLAQSELSQSEQPSCHGTTMDPQDRKNHDFNFQGNTSLFHVVSCNVQALLAFFPGADVSGIWSPRFHMVSWCFMAVTTCDQPVTSWGSQQRRTTSVCNAAEPWRVDGCKLFIYWNEWRRCHLSISTWAISIHFQFIQIPDLNFPEVSQSKCYYLDFSQDYWRVHIDSIEHIWTLLNMIELLVCTCQGRVQADVVSFNTALTACEGGEEFGMAIDSESTT